MLQFRQNDTSANLVLTLSEMVSLATPYYLFVFTNVSTKQVVSFVKSHTDDLSSYRERYNEFNINPSVTFLNKQTGEWHYIVYEQVSSTNTVVANTGAVLERGKLIILPSTGFEFSKYNESTSYKVYNG